MKITETTPVERTFTMELTEQEARTLFYLCGSVTGSDTNSRRKHTAAIFYALDALGIKTVSAAEVPHQIQLLNFRDSQEKL
jgi:hypothetical protein